jgi:hypothetical protein
MKAIISKENPTSKITIAQLRELIDLKLPYTHTCDSHDGCNKKFVIENSYDLQSSSYGVKGFWTYCPHCGESNCVTYSIGLEMYDSISDMLPHHFWAFEGIIELYRRNTGKYKKVKE